MKDTLRALTEWFFLRGDARTAAALRIGFASVYLLMLWDFRPMMPLIFGHGGLFGTLEPSPFGLDGPQHFLFHHDSPAELEVWYWGSCAICMAAMVGWWSRTTMLLTYGSMILFQERGPFMVFGADLVMRCVGLWILWLPLGQVWSMDARLRARRGHLVSGPVEVELWPARAIQIQVALVYLVTGLLKLQSPVWQSGAAVYYAMQVGDVFKGQEPSWVLSQRWLLAALNYGTLAIELTIPFMLFRRSLRNWAWVGGIMMHTGIDLLMSIRFFSAAMYTGYLAFLDPQDWRRLSEVWKRRTRS